jgi:hypothetical protein
MGIIHCVSAYMNEHVQIGLGIAAAITLIGTIVSFFRHSATLKGYEDYAADIKRVATSLRAEVFRDGNDVVITGNHQKHPVQVRFSYDENTPGLNIRMQAPVSFTLSVVPKGERATEGRVLVRTTNDMFDVKFATRTDHPTQAKMVIGNRAMMSSIEKLCCSSKTFLTLTRGTIEQSELIIPSPGTARHVIDHLDAMSRLAKGVDDIPGSEAIKVVPYQREKSAPMFRIALAVGAICTLVAIFVIKPTSAQPEIRGVNESSNQAPGVEPLDSMLIPDLAGFRAAESQDFDSSVAGWAGSAASGRVPMVIDGDEKADVAYWLVRADGTSRIIVLRNGTKAYDTPYPRVAGVARVPHDNLERIEWKQKPAGIPTGDGFAIVTPVGDGILQTVVLVPIQGRISFGIPNTFQTIPIR